MRRAVHLFIAATAVLCVAVPAMAQDFPQTPTPAAAPATTAPARPPMAGQRPTTPPAPPTPAMSAQRPAAAPTPPAVPEPAAPRIDSRIDPTDANVKLTVTITDKGPGGSLTKVVSLIVANRSNGRVRSSGLSTFAGKPDRNSELNVDANTTLYKSGVIYTSLTISYQPEWTEDATKLTAVTQSVTLFLKDGVPTVITQAADPTKGSRSVSIEVLASVMK